MILGVSETLRSRRAVTSIVVVLDSVATLASEARAAFGIGCRPDATPPFRRRIALLIATEMVAIRGAVLRTGFISTLHPF
jgi:hypothetical protein